MTPADDLPDANDLLDEEKEKQRFKHTMFTFLLFGFLQGIEITSPGKSPSGVLTPVRRQGYESKSLKYAALVTHTTKEQIQGAIDDTVAAGDGVKGLAKRIDDLYGESMGYRSLRIARTQLTESINDGTVSTLADEGNQEKEWSTVMDGAERESHAQADGQVVGINEPFKLAGGLAQFPGDSSLPPEESVNCRCLVVAPDASESRRLKIGRQFLRVHGALERRYVVSLRRAFREQRDRVLSRLPQ
jgi:hypothetical protein